MDSSSDVLSMTKTAPAKSATTLRRPVQIVKKRSGPLEYALGELDKNSCNNDSISSNKASTATIATSSKKSAPRPSSYTTSPPLQSRRCSNKDKEKKRERWLLTRKTWKYMADAGRKLIPDGAQNHKDDVPKIRAHFQQICASEPNFLLWRRKTSYPGAMRNSKKRLKQLLQHTGHKSQYIIEQEEIYNADQVLELLHSHLKLDESIKTDTLLGTKTVRPDQTSSPSAQRPKLSSSGVRRARGYGVEGSMPVSLCGPDFLPPQAHLQQLSEVKQLLERLLILSRSKILQDTIDIPPEKINADLLNDGATLKKIYTALKKQQLHRILSNHSMPTKQRTKLSHSSSMLSLIHFGSNSNSNVKPKQSIDTSTIIPLTPVVTTIPKTSSLPVSTSGHHTSTETTISTPTTSLNTINQQRQRNPPSSLDLPGYSSSSTVKVKNQQIHHNIVKKETNSCGTQTNFIQLNEIKRLAEEYKEHKREEAAAEAGDGSTTTEDEAEKQGGGNFHHRRKSSIDNEDVSQSVSDTIKRYLRMARKKSVHENNDNRFKRVNYDHNLRNIKAKGEINPPGMDEDNSKAIQTLDAWALISLDFIRGNNNSCILEMAHKEWQMALNERIQKKIEFEQKLMSQKESAGAINQQHPRVQHSVSSCSSSSAPTSPTSPLSPTMTNINSTSSSSSTYDVRPTAGAGGGVRGGETVVNVSGLLHSSTQFIANLWHGTTTSPSAVLKSGATNFNSNQPKPDHTNASDAFSSSLPITECFDVNFAADNTLDNQKSKSSSHVGQFVSQKLLRSRSKSQTRQAELSIFASPNTNFEVSKWTRTGPSTWYSNNNEKIVLHDTTFHNLSELEAKMVQKISMEKISELNIGINLTSYTDGKFHKRRILAKKKAMTTNFFDMGKKEFGNSNLSLFGKSLESYVDNENKKKITNICATVERGSKNSIAALFRIGDDIGSMDSHKQSDIIRSCESLPSGNQFVNATNRASTSSSSIKTLPKDNYFGNLAKSASMKISRSHSDVRSKSHEIESCSDLNHSNRESVDGGIVEMYKDLQVPKFVTSCVKYLEENGLQKIGLFRVSTTKKRVKQLREDFDKNSEKEFDIDTCPHNVATLLKGFLRDLPEPLLTNGLYNAFLETQKIRNRRLQLEAISHLVKLLPPAHRDTLYVLLRFLAKVAAYSDDVTNSDGSVHLAGNKMDSTNLATVFAPNILRSTLNTQHSSTYTEDRFQSTNEQESINDAINVIRIMIDHFEDLFRISAEVLDVVYMQLLDESPEQLYNICAYHSSLQSDEDVESGSESSTLDGSYSNDLIFQAPETDNSANNEKY